MLMSALNKLTAPSICVITKYYFPVHLQALVCWLRVFYYVSDCGVSRSSARTLRRTFGPRQRSVARALGVQSRAGGRFSKGLRSDPSSRAGPWKPPARHFCCVFALLPYLLHVIHQSSKTVPYTLTQSRYKSSRASSFPVVTTIYCEYTQRCDGPGQDGFMGGRSWWQDRKGIYRHNGVG